jgi:hypothetical protein
LQFVQRFHLRTMTAPERKFLQMAVALARTVRRGRDTELARAAADREILWQRELDAEPELHLMAAEQPPTYGEGDKQSDNGS